MEPQHINPSAHDSANDADGVPTESDVEAMFASSCDEGEIATESAEIDDLVTDPIQLDAPTLTPPDLLHTSPPPSLNRLTIANDQPTKEPHQTTTTNEQNHLEPKAVSFSISFDEPCASTQHPSAKTLGFGAKAEKKSSQQTKASDIESKLAEAERRRKEIRERKVSRAKMSIQRTMQINSVRQEMGVSAFAPKTSFVDSEHYTQARERAMQQLMLIDERIQKPLPKVAACKTVAHSKASRLPHEAARDIQRWFRKRRADRNAWATYFAAGLVESDVMRLRFDDAGALIQSRFTQGIASDVLTRLQESLHHLYKAKRYPAGYRFLTFNARAVLSAYMITSHPSTFSCGGSKAQESALLEAASVLIGLFEKMGVRSIGPSNVFDTSRTNARLLMEFEACWKAYLQRFKAWRRSDLLHMEGRLRADYLDLVRTRRFILGPENAPRSDRPDQQLWNEPLEQQIAVLRMRIAKIGGPAALERLRIEEEQMMKDLASIHQRRNMYAATIRDNTPGESLPPKSD